jgi:16S rRNA (guanine527-N7)-methyltransferase
MNNISMLKSGLAELNISCSEHQISSFTTYLAELKKWNRAYNLTALKTDRDIIIKHFLDSLLYLKSIPSGPIRLADAGTGAGFPGIPIKIICPQIHLDLIEPTRKKASFLRHITRRLDLTDITVIENRLEHLGQEHEKYYDTIVSRAAFHMKDFLMAACPYVKDNGLLVLSKGPNMSEELNELKDSPYRDAVREMVKLQLPFTDAQRNLIMLSCKMGT